jgi:hypothetical protein
MLKKTIVTIPSTGGTAEIYSGKYLDERKRILILAASDAESAVQLIVNSSKR